MVMRRMNVAVTPEPVRDGTAIVDSLEVHAEPFHAYVLAAIAESAGGRSVKRKLAGSTTTPEALSVTTTVSVIWAPTG
jgi:hypothetical protein